MAVLALSDPNLSYVKKALQLALPHIKSAHLSEAIAASLGFRTNIALKTFLRETSKKHSTVKHVKNEKLTQRLFDLTGTQITGFYLPEIVRSTELPDPIWREFKNEDMRLSRYRAISFWSFLPRMTVRPRFIDTFLTLSERVAKVERLSLPPATNR